MSKFIWQGSSGDDAPGDRKVNWKPELEAPPREVYDLMSRAREVGLWIRWARDPQVLARWRQRYRLSKAGSSAVVYASNDLNEIASCVAEFEADARA